MGEEKKDRGKAVEWRGLTAFLEKKKRPAADIGHNTAGGGVVDSM